MSVYVIAEAGSVADGSIGNMLALVDMAAECGADAFKGQDHRWQHIPEFEEHPSPYVNEKRLAYYERTALHEGGWYQVAERCSERGLDWIMSPFSVRSVESLSRTQRKGAAGFGPDAWKIASGEVTNRALLEAVKATGKPVYLSWGMASSTEILAACETLRTGRYTTALKCLMQCTSEYPCSPERVGLNVINDPDDMGRTHGGLVCTGLSDHTLGFAASLAAVTLGATVIERHVTLSRRMYGSDAAHSLEPDEFARFVREVRELDRMLANPVDKDELCRTPEIQRMREVFLCRQ